MVIKVLPSDGPKIRLWLPLSAIKWRWIYRLINKSEQQAFDFNKLQQIAIPLVQALRQYVRRHGHFDLVYINGGDGTKVRIRI